MSPSSASQHRIRVKGLDGAKDPVDLSEEEFLRHFTEGSIGGESMVHSSRIGLPWMRAHLAAIHIRRSQGEGCLPNRTDVFSDKQFRSPARESEDTLARAMVLLRGIQVLIHVPHECRIISVLSVTVCASPEAPGGKTWQQLAQKHRSFFLQQRMLADAAVQPLHPIWGLLDKDTLADMSHRHDLMPIIALEELKHQAAALGADLLIAPDTQENYLAGVESPVLRVKATCAMSSKLLQMQQRGRIEEHPPISDKATDERLSELSERERCVAQAEIALLARMEELQVRMTELDHREDSIASRERQGVPA